MAQAGWAWFAVAGERAALRGFNSRGGARAPGGLALRQDTPRSAPSPARAGCAEGGWAESGWADAGGAVAVRRGASVRPGSIGRGCCRVFSFGAKSVLNRSVSEDTVRASAWLKCYGTSGEECAGAAGN